MAANALEPILITGADDPRSPEQVSFRLQRLEMITRLMDDAIVLPGLGVRIGLDAAIGLIPGLGDLISAGVATWIVKEARLLGAPRFLIGRMMWNIGVDVVGGAVPLAGDLFDAYFKANRKNLELLKRWLKKQGYAVEMVVTAR